MDVNTSLQSMDVNTSLQSMDVNTSLQSSLLILGCIILITKIHSGLFCLVDAKYKFIYIDVGCNRRSSDAGLFRNSSLSLALS